MILSILENMHTYILKQIEVNKSHIKTDIHKSLYGSSCTRINGMRMEIGDMTANLKQITSSQSTFKTTSMSN